MLPTLGSLEDVVVLRSSDETFAAVDALGFLMLPSLSFSLQDKLITGTASLSFSLPGKLTTGTASEFCCLLEMFNVKIIFVSPFCVKLIASKASINYLVRSSSEVGADSSTRTSVQCRCYGLGRIPEPMFPNDLRQHLSQRTRESWSARLHDATCCVLC